MLKNYRFALEVDGANMFLIQEVQPPDVELAKVEHGAPGNLPAGKTPGKMKIGDMTVKKLKPVAGPDTWVWDWMAKAIAGLPATFMKTAFLVELAPDGVTVVNKFYLGNIWPQKNNHSGYKTTGDGENVIETITFCVQYYYPTTSLEFTALFGGSGARAAGLAGTLGQP